ncbi:MAG: hypothetical protein H8E08_00055 [Candidatus Marinimicrobia bacterium]|nr:hypothetical protein [Candidatus Neomarinimicrobiota bacterium]
MKYIKSYNQLKVWEAPLFLFILSFFLFIACPDPPKDNTPNRDTTIHLEVLSTFTTTAKLYISVEDTTAEWTFGLTRNGEDILTATVYNGDTTFTDNGLTPNTQYTYQAQWLNNGLAVDSSLNTIVQTMDTTSHNFIWEFDTLGDPGSYLKDVDIVNENNIWVVGKIRDGDSTYNVAHWDGSIWEYIFIDLNVDFDGVFAFDERDIWFVNGCFVYYYDGLTFTKQFECDYETYGPNLIQKAWGTSSSNMYFIGNSGSIVHYDGTTFTRMESGTDLPLLNITGSGDKIFVTAMGYYGDFIGSALLANENDNWHSVFSSDNYLPDGSEENYGFFFGIDVYGDTTYIYSKAGVIHYNYLTGHYLLDSAKVNLFYYDYHTLKVQSPNDIILFSYSGMTLHYNGMDWQRDRGTWITGNGNLYFNGTYKDDVAIVVGQLAYYGALIAVGRHQL